MNTKIIYKLSSKRRAKILKHLRNMQTIRAWKDNGYRFIAEINSGNNYSMFKVEPKYSKGWWYVEGCDDLTKPNLMPKPNTGNGGVHVPEELLLIAKKFERGNYEWCVSLEDLYLNELVKIYDILDAKEEER